MSKQNSGLPDSTREPGLIAYYSVLAATASGTLSSTVINAPLHRIQTEFGVGDSTVVLVVAAFTVAMVVFMPLMGWLSDRFGPIRIVVAGLILMALAQMLAAIAPNLELIVMARAVQGAACAVLPPGVQRALIMLWPSRQASSMVAWASAIGVGQALGPPFGGIVSELIHWRAVFVLQAVVCIVIVTAILLTVPRIPGRDTPIHGVGMVALMVMMGASVLAITLAGQRADLLTEITVIVVATVGLVVFLVLASRHQGRLVEPRALWEKRFIRGTVNAGVAMFIIGTCMVSVPLYLGKMGMSPGPVGFTIFAMAFAMATSGFLLNRLSRRFTSRTLLICGLNALAGAPVIMGAWMTFATQELRVQVPVVVSMLLLIGTAVTAGQSVAALTISRSRIAQNSMAFGIHNTVRFLGMGSGYAWASLMLPLNIPVVLFAGASLMVVIALLVTVVGGPAEALGNDPD